MASTFKTPGVYIQEIVTLPPSIAGVNTAIPAFIGYTQKAEKNKENVVGIPVRISSLIEYENYFGKAQLETAIKITLEDKLDGLGNKIGTESKVEFTGAAAGIGPNPGASPFLMYYSLKMYFDNGGGPCWIVSAELIPPPEDGDGGAAAAAAPTIDKAVLKTALEKIAKEDEPTLLVFPDAINLASVGDYYEVMKTGLTQCKDLQDRFTIMDVYSNDKADTPLNNAAVLRNAATLGADLDDLKYGAAYYPWLKTTIPFEYDETKVDVEVGAATAKLNTLKDTKTQDYNLAKAALSQFYVTLPPSAAMAGIYARVDRDRGVWKAPANVSVNSVSALTIKVNDEEQGELNIDPTSGKSINVIRSFTGKGILVWGARTLAGNDNEWRYVSVRRFYIFVEESTKKATAQFVFEPNDANTWIRVKAMIENFLIQQWRAGALAGATPQEAFFVKVGLGTTMTALDILEGRMNIEIGMAVVRPAEFIILKFSHKMQES